MRIEESSADTFVVKNATLAKPETVSGNPKTNITIGYEICTETK